MLAKLSTIALAALAVLVASVAALPATDLVTRQVADGPFTVSDATVAAAITCPDGTDNAPNGLVLLIHGTGGTGEVAWSFTPYVKNLPSRQGVKVCWIDLPSMSQAPIPLSGEYVAKFIQMYAPKSATGKVFVISHSQGGVDVQHALNYYPSTRKLTTAFYPLSSPFHGTDFGPAACAVITAGTVGQGCTPAVHQQSTGSRYLAALNKRADLALVPTTSIYTFDDEVVPQIRPPPTSQVKQGGAATTSYSIQEVCSVLAFSEHFGMLAHPVAYFLVVDGIQNKGVAQKSRVDRTVACSLDNYLVATSLSNNTLANGVGFAENVFQAPPSFVLAMKTLLEPRLPRFICNLGDSTYC